MSINEFDIENFNIIQDEDNYYFFRALNMADNNDIENGITVLNNGNIFKIRTDRERYDGETKYNKESKMSLEEIYDHIKMPNRKDTNCISLTTNCNVAVNYGRGSYKDRYVMIKIPKKQFNKKVVFAGQYMLRELHSRIQKTVESMPIERKQKVLDFFNRIEDATSIRSLKNIIAKRYTAKTDSVKLNKTHSKQGIVYRLTKARIISYQSLSENQLLEVNKIYAKLEVLEKEGMLIHVIPNSSNTKLRKTIGNAFSSTEVIHYGDISQDSIIEIPTEIMDAFAITQQVKGIDERKIESFKRALIKVVLGGIPIPPITNDKLQVRDNISIEEMYNLTNGIVEYEKANSIIKTMFYLSKSRKNAIAISNVLNEIFGSDSEFRDIIYYIRDKGFRVEPEIISRKSGKGVKISESVNLNLTEEEFLLIEEIIKMSSEELEIVLQNGGVFNTLHIISNLFNNLKETDKSIYYADAIVSKYNWHAIGISLKPSERKKIVLRLHEINCIDIYNKLCEFGVEEEKIPIILINIAIRENFFEQYKIEYLEELIKTSQDLYKITIEQFREYGLGLKNKTTYEEVIEFLATHNGQMMKCEFRNKKGTRLGINEMTEEQQYEAHLYARWKKSSERDVLKKYAGKPIEEVPEEYRDKIEQLREYGLGLKNKTTYEEVIEFLDTHNCQMMKSYFKNEKGTKLRRDEMTEDQIYEINLYKRWLYSLERKVLEEYAGRPIEEVPEEYRDIVKQLREYGLGLKNKTTYEEVIEFLATHNGQMMKCEFRNKKGTRLGINEMTEEQQYEAHLYARWKKSSERDVLKKYAGKPIEEVPEEYRDKIERLREYGLGLKNKTTYEEVIEFLDTHNCQMMKSYFKNKKGTKLRRDEMTEDQIYEINLYKRWLYSLERKVLEEYAGRPIEEVPEEYRDKIEQLRKHGLGDKKSKLKEAKQKRDNAKITNTGVRQLEIEIQNTLEDKRSHSK